MSESIACPKCQRRLRLPEEFRDRDVQCPSCQTYFQAPAAPPVAPPTATAPPEATALSAVPRPALAPIYATRRTTHHDDRDAGAGKPPPRRKRTPWWVVGVAAVAGVAVLFALAEIGKPAKVRPPAPNWDANRIPEVKAALGDQNPVAAGQLTQDLKPLFDGLGIAFRSNNREQILAYFDSDRLIDECEAQGALAQFSAREKRGFRDGARVGLGNAMQSMAPIMRWESIEIRHIKSLSNVEAVAIVRHRGENGTSLKLRWWVTRQSGAWKIYDFEDLDAGIRGSDSISALLALGVGKGTEIGKAVLPLREALTALALRQDADTAEAKLRSIAAVNFPPHLEALRAMTQGLIHLNRAQSQDALDQFTRAGTLFPDMPVLDLLKGGALNQLGEWDDARRHLEKYRDLLGEDGPICFQLARALQGLRRFTEAARFYRKALDFDPRSGEVFLGLLRSLEWDVGMDDVGPRFAKLEQPHENFDVCAADCDERKHDGLLERLATAMNKIDPKYAPADYYLALVKARAHKPGEAVPLFKSALVKEKDAAARERYSRAVLTALAEFGAAAEAYAALPDGRTAFRLLAPELVKRFQFDALKETLVAHAKAHADDPLVPLYQAEVYVNEGRYALAEKSFAAALAKKPDPDTLEPFRASRVVARYHLGQGMSAYREIGPRPDTFRQLAALCFADADHAQLRALLDAHARSEPDSIDLHQYQSRLKIQQNQLADGIALFKALLAKKISDKERSAVVDTFLSDMMEAGHALESYRAAPDAKYAFGYLAAEMLEESRWDELRLLNAAHAAAHADDPWLNYYRGEVCLDDKDWRKAAAVFQEGRKTAPDDLQPSLRGQLVFALYKAGQGMQAYAEVGLREETFSRLAGLYADDKDGAGLQDLIKAHRPLAGDSPEVDYFEARANVFLGRYGEATALLKKAFQRQTNDFQQRIYVTGFMSDMESAGHGLDGYRAAPDPTAAFAQLAALWLEKKNDQELSSLLDEHGKGHADEPLHKFFRGELLLRSGDAKAAEPFFAAAFAKGLPHDQWRFRGGLFRVRVKLGETVRTYRETEPGPATFEALAEECFHQENAGQLRALIDEYRKSHPDDPRAFVREMEFLWLKRDYDGALTQLAEHRNDVFLLPQNRWIYTNYLVRCLVKQKRFADAVREAEAAAKKRLGNDLLLVLAHAASGDVKQTVAVVEKQKRSSYLLTSWYDDPDLGPILRSEPFAEFRKKFPEPERK